MDGWRQERIREINNIDDEALSSKLDMYTVDAIGFRIVVTLKSTLPLAWSDSAKAPPAPTKKVKIELEQHIGRVAVWRN